MFSLGLRLGASSAQMVFRTADVTFQRLAVLAFWVTTGCRPRTALASTLTSQLGAAPLAK